MIAVEASKADARVPQVWPLSVKAYHTLGEMGLIPERTELLYGQVFHRIEIHRQPVGDRYADCQVLGPDGRLASAAVPAIAVELAGLFEK